MRAQLGMFCLALLLQSHIMAAQVQVPSISTFDGIKSPIAGLFEEPIPEEYFSKNLMEAYQSGDYYHGTFSLAKTNRQSAHDAVSLYNPSEQTIDVVFSCVKLEKAKSKNFIVKVPATQYQQVDITAFRGFDQIFILSFSAVEVYFDTNSKDRRNVSLDTVEIVPPIDRDLSATDSKFCILGASRDVSIKHDRTGASLRVRASYQR